MKDANTNTSQKSFLLLAKINAVWGLLTTRAKNALAWDKLFSKRTLQCRSFIYKDRRPPRTFIFVMSWCLLKKERDQSIAIPGAFCCVLWAWWMGAAVIFNIEPCQMWSEMGTVLEKGVKCADYFLIGF